MTSDVEHEAGSPSESPGRRVRAVIHASSILRCLGDAPGPLAVSEVATRVGLSRTSTYHLLRTMEDERFVAKDVEHRYRLSWALFELGGSVSEIVELNRLLRPHLDALAAETSSPTLLAIREGTSVLYVDRAQVDPQFTMIPWPGRRAPFHATSSGKAILAHQPDEFVDEFLQNELPRYTSHTICDPVRLRDQLAEIREAGYATNRQEFEIGIDSIAAPVFGYQGQVQASMTLVRPALRTAHHALDEWAAALTKHTVHATGQVQSRSVAPRASRRAI